MGRTCTSSCPYYGVDENYNGYCKKDHNSYRERYSKCTFEDDTSEKDSKSSSSSHLSGSNSSSSSGGCYVATCVYGSYDCPPVWTLRRYRDFVLSKTVYGRAFIKTYYAVSPTLVKWFGNTNWFKKMWKTPLDKLVSRLNNRGIKDTAYKDNQ